MSGTRVSTTLPTNSHVARGQALFLNKGCSTCHRHTGLDTAVQSVELGPDLSNYRATPEFLRQWLTNPVALRPETLMPNLNLSPEEIEDLIAFLNVAR